MFGSHLQACVLLQVHGTTGLQLQFEERLTHTQTDRQSTTHTITTNAAVLFIALMFPDVVDAIGGCDNHCGDAVADRQAKPVLPLAIQNQPQQSHFALCGLDQ